MLFWCTREVKHLEESTISKCMKWPISHLLSKYWIWKYCRRWRFFAIAMVGISYLLGIYVNETQDSEMLSTAKRSIKTGLVASSVVSSWTIGATLLLSCTTTYNLGVAAAWWYGAGACVQIIIFFVASLELKRKVPNC